MKKTFFALIAFAVSATALASQDPPGSMQINCSLFRSDSGSKTKTAVLNDVIVDERQVSTLVRSNHHKYRFIMGRIGTHGSFPPEYDGNYLLTVIMDADKRDYDHGWSTHPDVLNISFSKEQKRFFADLKTEHPNRKTNKHWQIECGVLGLTGQ